MDDYGAPRRKQPCDLRSSVDLDVLRAGAGRRPGPENPPPPAPPPAPAPARARARARAPARAPAPASATGPEILGPRYRREHLRVLARLPLIRDTNEHDQHHPHRRRQRRVHPDPARRPRRVPRAGRLDDRAARHRRRAPRYRRADRAPINAPAGTDLRIRATLDRRAALGRRRLRRQRDPGRRPRRHAARLRDPGALRAAPDDRRHDRRRRDLPRAAHDPGAAGDRATTWPRCAPTRCC